MSSTSSDSPAEVPPPAKRTTFTFGPPTPESDPPIKLRTYQEAAVGAFFAAYAAGMRRIGLSAPTGAGKTLVFSTIIRKVLEECRYGKVLVLVNNEELANQAAAKIRHVFDNMVSIGHERNVHRADPGDRV
jgi:superfamily II DNA or RNA helicase